MPIQMITNIYKTNHAQSKIYCLFGKFPKERMKFEMTVLIHRH